VSITLEDSAEGSASSPNWPTEIIVKRMQRVLSVTFENGRVYEIPFELLRVESPSAQVQGHSAGQKKIVTGKANVTIVGVEPVGRYGVRLVFDDGHNSGIYTWDWLHRLGHGQISLMADYKKAISAIEAEPQ
jgi:DUF971 family protein